MVATRNLFDALVGEEENNNAMVVVEQHEQFIVQKEATTNVKEATNSTNPSGHWIQNAVVNNP